jgi:hypothetical protein
MADIRANTRDDVEQLRAALLQAQRALAMLVSPESITNTSVSTAWVNAVAAEAKARAVLNATNAREAVGGDRNG